MLDKVIRYSIYLIFFLVPLIFAGNTSELFEFNKMWLTFGLTTLITLAWLSKMILEKNVHIQRTPLDIPLLLFLLSQIISSIFSLDQQVSWWGYYSRFNGGLLSTITYILLYYAVASNFSPKQILKLLKFTLAGGVMSALWGLPSHFGYDPTCLLFRGSLDTSCWTDAFKPTVRVFSTLGQPAWFAAYLAALLPLSMYYALTKIKGHLGGSLTNWKFLTYTASMVIFYLNLIFTNTRAGYIGFVAANIVFWAIIFFTKCLSKKLFLTYFIFFNGIMLVTTFVFGIPDDNLYKFTLPGITASRAQQASSQAAPIALNPTPTPSTPNQAGTQSQAAPATSPTPPPVIAESNITDSGDIRLYVWKGAIDAWKANPLFGTGVETFAFAYYKFRPVGHNMTSEWDYLYNKAHNEYLNYLTTTGIFGLGTYLAFIGLFIFFWLKNILKPQNTQHTKSSDNQKAKTSEVIISQNLLHILSIGLVAGWSSILISNFFGFSVVIINLFLFLFPLFVFILEERLNPERAWELSWGNTDKQVNPYQWTLIVIITCVAGYFIIILCQYWYADTKYALGYNLDRVGSYQNAYPLLLDAVKIEPNESVYKDELAVNLAVLATALAAQKDQTNADAFTNNAITLDNQVVTDHPNNVVYWKDRVRLFYTLAQIGNPNQQALYYQEALKSIQKANELAPTDAKISYNLGVLYGQNGDIPKGITVLKQTIQMKSDYRDPYFALGLFYHQLAIDANGNVSNEQYQQQAVDTYNYILTHLNPNDQEVQKSLKEWEAAK